MTTSITTACVSPDFIITTPAQLKEAFKVWVERYQGDPESFNISLDSVPSNEYSDSCAECMIAILQELNSKG